MSSPRYTVEEIASWCVVYIVRIHPADCEFRAPYDAVCTLVYDPSDGQLMVKGMSGVGITRNHVRALFKWVRENLPEAETLSWERMHNGRLSIKIINLSVGE